MVLGESRRNSVLMRFPIPPLPKGSCDAVEQSKQQCSLQAYAVKTTDVKRDTKLTLFLLFHK